MNVHIEAAPAKRSLDEQPQFFATSHGVLFGVLHRSAAECTRDAVIVHCHSFGVEHLIPYRTEVLCARAAAERGFSTLRYHARGHGDSSGDPALVSLPSLVEDALAAAQHARLVTRARRVVWVGVRMGALVATAAAKRCPFTAGLSLWDPVWTGAQYLKELLRAHTVARLGEGRAPELVLEDLLQPGGVLDVNGYPVYARFAQSVQALELESLLASADWPLQILSVYPARRGRSAELSEAHAALLTRLSAHHPRVTWQVLQDDAGWMLMRNPAWESPDLARATVKWLDEHC